MKIVLIATGGEDLGYGHIMRSLTFYKNAPDNTTIIFCPFVKERDRRLFPKNENIIFPLTYIDLIQYVNKFEPDIIVWDTVDFDENSFFELRKYYKKHISISPVFKYMKYIDIVFSRNPNQLKEKFVTYFLGMEYAIFNENCFFITDEVYIKNLSKKNLVVGISMGGGDAPNNTQKVLEALAGINLQMTIWVLLGEGYNHSYQNLVDTINRSSEHEIILAKTNRSMWEILSNCNVAILAGGLMLIESVYAGLPSINLFENSIHEITAGSILFDANAAKSVGNIHDSLSLNRMNDLLITMDDKKSLLLDMRENCKGMIDKNASKRIYNILTEVC